MTNRCMSSEAPLSHHQARSPHGGHNNNNRIQTCYSRFLQSPHSAANCLKRMLKWPGRNRVQITCNTSSAYHVQVSCYVPLGTKGQLS